jgi:sporulation-control protein spo0M
MLRARRQVAGSHRGKCSSRLHETPKVEQVDEDTLEAVVPIDERTAKAPSFAEEARQRDLRLLRVVFHQSCALASSN